MAIAVLIMALINVRDWGYIHPKPELEEQVEEFSSKPTHQILIAPQIPSAGELVSESDYFLFCALYLLKTAKLDSKSIDEFRE